ncbi:Uncharacterised protein [Mycobacteroides abscessus subsp. abscessus]|nr:Uncharacterised protein [Mycobacteroides abscessus subsp. abscessus]
MTVHDDDAPAPLNSRSGPHLRAPGRWRCSKQSEQPPADGRPNSRQMHPKLAHPTEVFASLLAVGFCEGGYFAPIFTPVPAATPTLPDTVFNSQCAELVPAEAPGKPLRDQKIIWG